jgi:hypothetical protein
MGDVTLCAFVHKLFNKQKKNEKGHSLLSLVISKISEYLETFCLTNSIIIFIFNWDEIVRLCGLAFKSLPCYYSILNDKISFSVLLWFLVTKK